MSTMTCFNCSNPDVEIDATADTICRDCGMVLVTDDPDAAMAAEEADRG